MISIDEAITHAREVAKRNREQWKNCPADRRDIELQTCEQCAEEHEQLAEWLEDYKRLKELFSKAFLKDCNTCKQEIYQKAYIEGRDKGFSDGHFFGYNKAIDDFVNACKDNILCQTFGLHQNGIEKIAEQLKVGK